MNPQECCHSMIDAEERCCFICKEPMLKCHKCREWVARLTDNWCDTCMALAEEADEARREVRRA